MQTIPSIELLKAWTEKEKFWHKVSVSQKAIAVPIARYGNGPRCDVYKSVTYISSSGNETVFCKKLLRNYF